MTSLLPAHDGITHAPFITDETLPHRTPHRLPGGARLAVSVLLHAPLYEDPLPAWAHRPTSMLGGVGRSTAEPRSGQVARLAQWDYGLTCGLFRLMDDLDRLGVPYAVALDALGCRRMPGLAREVARRAGEIVCRGWSANRVISPDMDEDLERAYIERSLAAVRGATGRDVDGWWSPERATSPRTPALLVRAGVTWTGDLALDEFPVPLTGAASGLTAVPFSLECEDAFALLRRGLPVDHWEAMLDRTARQLLADGGHSARFLGLGLHGWIAGQPCYADAATGVLAALTRHPDASLMTPGAAAALIPAAGPRP